MAIKDILFGTEDFEQDLLGGGIYRPKSEAQKNCEAKGGKWINGACVLPEAKPEAKPEITQTISKKSQSQLTCEAKGGKWDEAKQTCIMPEAITRQRSIEKQATEDKSQFGALRDSETGRLSGFEIGGKTYLGVSPEETRKAIEAEANKQELEIGGQAEAVLEQRRQELQTQGVEYAGQIGGSPDEQALSQIQSSLTQGKIDHLAALSSAVPGLIPDFFTGFGATAILTKGATKGIAPTVVGVGNLALGVFRSYVSDISRQQGDIIETPIRTLTESKGVMTSIIGMQNANPQASQQNLDAYNVVRTTIDMEYEHLKELSDNDLNKFLGENAINQMKEYEVYYLPYGERWQFDQEMASALANPDPSNTRIPFDIQELLKKKIEEKL